MGRGVGIWTSDSRYGGCLFDGAQARVEAWEWAKDFLCGCGNPKLWIYCDPASGSTVRGNEWERAGVWGPLYSQPRC